MTFGILLCGVNMGCVDNSKPCGIQDSGQALLCCSSIFFDVIAMITLITVGSLALKGRIHLPTKAGIGLLGGAGAVLLLPLLPTLKRCYQGP